MTSYGEVGVNVGSVGRWTRLVMGIGVMVMVAADFYPVTHEHSVASYLMIVASFVAITGIYTLGHVPLPAGSGPSPGPLPGRRTSTV